MLRLFLFLISLAISIYILRSQVIHDLILHLGTYEYIGAFVAGFFFVMTFTVAPAAAVLITLTDTMHPLLLALIGGIGGVCGDFVLWKFYRSETDDLIAEVKARRHKSIMKFLKSRFLAWLGPVIGAIIIASPFPDELGITLLGITKLETKKFLAIVFILDVLSVLFITSIGSIFY